MSDPVTPYTTYPAIPKGVITRQPGARLKISRDGVAVLTETYIGSFTDLLTSSLTISGSTHPEFPSLWVWSSEITEGKGGIGTLSVESRGVNGNLPDPIYSLERTTSNEPIATNPKWITDIAGTPAAPLHGAIFVDASGNVSTDSTATFKGWSNDSDCRGLEDYLCPGSTWSSSYVDYNPPDLSGVGLISTPDGPCPAAPDGYFWIFIGASCSQQGSVYRIQKTWKLSGGVLTSIANILYGGGS